MSEAGGGQRAQCQVMPRALATARATTPSHSTPTYRTRTHKRTHTWSSKIHIPNTKPRTYLPLSVRRENKENNQRWTKQHRRYGAETLYNSTENGIHI